jgi:hypothetical protein
MNWYKACAASSSIKMVMVYIRTHALQADSNRFFVKQRSPYHTGVFMWQWSSNYSCGRPTVRLHSGATGLETLVKTTCSCLRINNGCKHDVIQYVHTSPYNRTFTPWFVYYIFWTWRDHSKNIENKTKSTNSCF